MLKLLPTALIFSFLIFSVPAQYQPVKAGTCVAGSSCGPQPLRFVPGQRITVEVVNLTGSMVKLQQVAGTNSVPISPGQVYSFVRGGSTDPNFSLVLWNAMGLPLKVNLLKPGARTLRIEVRRGGRSPGDRTVYLKDDGSVGIF